MWHGSCWCGRLFVGLVLLPTIFAILSVQGSRSLQEDLLVTDVGEPIPLWQWEVVCRRAAELSTILENIELLVTGEAGNSFPEEAADNISTTISAIHMDANRLADELVSHPFPVSSRVMVEATGKLVMLRERLSGLVAYVTNLIEPLYSSFQEDISMFAAVAGA